MEAQKVFFSYAKESAIVTEGSSQEEEEGARLYSACSPNPPPKVENPIHNTLDAAPRVPSTSHVVVLLGEEEDDQGMTNFAVNPEPRRSRHGQFCHQPRTFYA